LKFKPDIFSDSKAKTIQTNLEELEASIRYYSDYDNYLRKALRDQYIQNTLFIKKSLDQLRLRRLLPNSSKRKMQHNLCLQKVTSIQRFLENYPRNYADHCSKNRHRDFFSKYRLDPNQVEAVVKDDQYNLVIAAAGSGKTRVLTTRIAYLVHCGVDPSKILALAYTNQACDEMQDRLSNEFGVSNVRVTTLHSFGRSLVVNHGKEMKNSVADNDKQIEFVRDSFKNMLDSGNKDFGLSLLRFTAEWNRYNKFRNQKPESFADAEEKCVALDSTEVDSFGEREIADFLFLNQIKYKHSAVATWADQSRSYRSYEPDFYLPDYDLYIEHRGFDRNGKVAPWIKGSPQNNLVGKTVYEERTYWSRLQYKKHHKELIETFYYEQQEGSLISKLKKKLEDKRVILSQISSDQIQAHIRARHLDTLDSIIENILRFINVAKSNRLTFSIVSERFQKRKLSAFQQSFGKLVLPIWKQYEDWLEQNNMIDFNDMINQALDIACANKTELAGTYSHLLVDEFQDITNNQLELVRTLLSEDGTNTLFCVGDDWQNIFSFAGANIQNILSFEEVFPHTEKTILETNYRCPRNVVEASNLCISHNQFQIRKRIRAASTKDCSIHLYERSRNFGKYDEWEEYTAKEILTRLLETKAESEEILVLSRYKFRLWGLQRFFPHSDKNNLKFMTIHKAKGTEAEYILVLGLVKGLQGFPSEMTDPEIFNLAKSDGASNSEKTTLEEERRLFYVALTRCKKEIHIFTSKKNQSPFVSEIDRFPTIRTA
jgi:DNA helicase-4